VLPQRGPGLRLGGHELPHLARAVAQTRAACQVAPACGQVEHVRASLVQRRLRGKDLLAERAVGNRVDRHGDARGEEVQLDERGQLLDAGAAEDGQPRRPLSPPPLFAQPGVDAEERVGLRIVQRGQRGLAEDLGGLFRLPGLDGMLQTRDERAEGGVTALPARGEPVQQGLSCGSRLAHGCSTPHCALPVATSRPSGPSTRMSSRIVPTEAWASATATVTVRPSPT